MWANIPVNTIVQNDLESSVNQLYVGTDFGTYIKIGNEDWTLYGTEFPKVDVTGLDIYYDRVNPENSRLRASTYGRGMWEVPLELSGNFAPYITTDSITNVTNKIATVYGTIVDDYNNSVTESGIILSQNPNPDLNDNDIILIQTDPLVDMGNFSVDFTGLSFASNYYCKAYAINTNGISYGKEISFITDATSIDDIENSDFVTIYPNPSTGILNIDFKNTHELVNINISDISGKIFYSEKINTSEKQSIMLSHLAKGIYFIRIKFFDRIFVSNLIVK